MDSETPIVCEAVPVAPQARADNLPRTAMKDVFDCDDDGRYPRRHGKYALDQQKYRRPSSHHGRLYQNESRVSVGCRVFLRGIFQFASSTCYHNRPDFDFSNVVLEMKYNSGNWRTATAHIVTVVVGGGVLSLGWAMAQVSHQA